MNARRYPCAIEYIAPTIGSAAIAKILMSAVTSVIIAAAATAPPLATVIANSKTFSDCITVYVSGAILRRVF